MSDLLKCTRGFTIADDISIARALVYYDRLLSSQLHPRSHRPSVSVGCRLWCNGCVSRLPWVSCRDLQPAAPLLHQSVGGFPLACLGFLPGQRERGPVEGTCSVVLAAVCTATLLLWACWHKHGSLRVAIWYVMTMSSFTYRMLRHAV